MTDVNAIVKQFILEKFLPGEDPDALTETTPLVTTGILDSLSTMRLVSFLEERFNIRIAAHEASVDYLNTLASITALVQSKQ
jgi:acyl carrier protein